MLVNFQNKKILLTLSLAVLSGSFPAATAADEVSDVDVLPAGVEVDILEVQLHAFPSQEAFHGQLSIRAIVRNKTEAELTLKRNDFRCTVESQTSFNNPAIQSPLITRDTQLEPGDEKEGWLAFQVRHATIGEPKLQLIVSSDGRSRVLSVNDALRRLTAISCSLMGPNDCLAVISVNRTLDRMSIWLLNEEFRRLDGIGIQRVVIDASGARPSAGGGVPFRSSFQNVVGTWLASASTRKTTTRFTSRTGPKSPVQFAELFAVNVPATSVTRRYVSTSSRSYYRATRELAIADALRTAYESVTEKQSLQDLKHSEPGIRRVALEACVDQLTQDQLQQILDDAESESIGFQMMVAENLYRVALPIGATALDGMVRSSAPQVSRAALSSLVRSVSPTADDSLRRLWHESKADLTRQQEIVDAIIQGKSYDQTDLLAEFATRQLKRFSYANSEKGEASPQAATVTKTTVRPDTAKLKILFHFLQQQEYEPFDATARRKLLDIAEPAVQDIVLEFVLASEESDAFELARQYIRQRLLDWPTVGGLNASEQQQLDIRLLQRGLPSRSAITSTLLATVKKYPDTMYAARLLELSNSRSVASNLKSVAFQAALICVSESDLQPLIDEFEHLDHTRKRELLTHLLTVEHPNRFSLISSCFEDKKTVAIALSVLRGDQSPEALQIVVEQLDALRVKVEAEAAAEIGIQAKKVTPEESEPAETPGLRLPAPVIPLSPSSRPMTGRLSKWYYQPASQLMEQLNSHSHRYIHPDARRLMNRLRRSPVSDLEKLATSSTIRSNRMLPRTLQVKILEAYNFQEEGDFAGSRTAFEDVVRVDPFYVHAYTALASLCLREGNGVEAMEHLRTADRLNPEDIHTQSMIALTEIRLGNIQNGIDLAEEILISVPDLATNLRCDTLYNTACTYGRAIEVEKSATARQKYRDRAIELLKDCVNREQGFSDESHILADPDLNVFHDDEDWPALLKQIRENESSEKKDLDDE